MADFNPSIVTWKNAGGSRIVHTLVTEGTARLWGQEFASAGAACGTLPAPAVLDPTREMAVGGEGPHLDLAVSLSLGNISKRKPWLAYEQFPSCLWPGSAPRRLLSQDESLGIPVSHQENPQRAEFCSN